MLAKEGSHSLQSHRRTVPPPFSPSGMMPSNSPYSTGWSSTCMARRLIEASRLGPLGTALLLSTPFISRRKSYCSVSGGVLLHDKRAPALTALLSRGLWSPLEVAFASVVSKAHDTHQLQCDSAGEA
jgi:hypothetical protein